MGGRLTTRGAVIATTASTCLGFILGMTEEEDDESSVVSDDEPDPVVVFHCLELKKKSICYLLPFSI